MNPTWSMREVVGLEFSGMYRGLPFFWRKRMQKILFPLIVAAGQRDHKDVTEGGTAGDKTKLPLQL